MSGPGSEHARAVAAYKERLAKKHAEGEVRMRAILASEAPPVKRSSKAKPALSERARRRVAQARETYEAIAAKERALGATPFRVDMPSPNHSNLSTGSSRIALSRLKKAQRKAAATMAELAIRQWIGQGFAGTAPDRARFAVEQPSEVLRRYGPMTATVRLTRVAPSNGLDPHDGLRTALKAFVDGVADALGLANDRDPRVTWEYGQRRGLFGEHAVEVAITFSKRL